jgi:hypothetical protein
MMLMRYAHMQFSEIQKLEWDSLVWLYDEMMKSFNMATPQEKK